MDSSAALQLIDDYLDGGDDDEAIAQLKTWLESDVANLEVFARAVFFHQQLRESLLAENSARFLKESSNPEAIEEASRPASFPRDLGAGTAWSRSSLGLFFAFALLIAVGGYFAYNSRWMASGSAKKAMPVQISNIARSAVPYEAKLVKVTNCVWDSAHSTANLNRDSEISPGQTLCLLEGVAEINSVLPDGKVGKFILEGPVSLMMTSQGVPSLQYGKLSVTISGESDLFALDTGLGSVVASANASFGINSYANQVELHVFAGNVTFEPAQLFSAVSSASPFKVVAGSSLRISLGSERNIAVKKGVAEEEAFITPASMNASHLNISKEYVAAVKQAKPVAYWRFDRVEENIIPNVMGNRYACRVQGGMKWRTYPSGNRTAEFGASSQPGLLLSDDDLADVLKDKYSIEFWMKPDYCQLGSVFLLVKCGLDSSKLPLHSVIVELIGPASDPGSSPVQIDRVRFLQRSPPGNDPHLGTSCYSDFPYAPRLWQHVVAIKDGSVMKLYMDGKLSAEAKDDSNVPGGLRILMGQLFTATSGPNANTRPFVGELGEVAVYDRPLTQAEIDKHIVLVRSELTGKNSW